MVFQKYLRGPSKTAVDQANGMVTNKDVNAIAFRQGWGD